MRIVFFGSPQFAVPALDQLASERDIEVALVVTQPDRPTGRGRRMTPAPVGAAADRMSLPTLKPETLRDDDIVATLADVDADVFVVIAYGEILRKPLLEMAPFGCVNVHPSLLPRYRGAAPMPAAILNGDEQTGISYMQLVRRLDAGPVLQQHVVPIQPGETAGELSERVATQAARDLPDVLRKYLGRELTPIVQDESLATYTREWTVADARLDWRQPAEELARLVRAANPWPMAWTDHDGQRLRVLAAQSAEGLLSPGDVAKDGRRVLVGTADGVLDLVTVQPAGKRAMDAAAWWNGLQGDRTRFE